MNQKEKQGNRIRIIAFLLIFSGILSFQSQPHLKYGLMGLGLIIYILGVVIYLDAVEEGQSGEAK